MAPLEVIWNRLVALVDEVAADIKRMSFSTIVRESNDFAYVLTTAKGEPIVHNSLGMPSFIGCMARTVKQILQCSASENLQPGDVLITNDPWIGGGHLPDIVIMTPIFWKNELIAYSLSICHATDIGGRLWSADCTELFEEGLQIPVVKLYKGGCINDELIQLIRTNVRTPQQFVGDIYAQASANALMQGRLIEALDELKVDSFEKVCEEIFSLSENAMRREIAILHDGTYHAEVKADGFDEPVTLQVTININGSNITVDYDGTSSEVGRGINVVFNYTYSWTMFALKTLLAPELPLNEGNLVPIQVKAPKGCILNARRPVAVGGRHTIGRNAAFAIYKAWAHIQPEKTIAIGGHSGYPFFGWTDEKGIQYTQFMPMCGGMGARHSKDGLSATYFPTNASNTPIEIVESIAPLRILRKELVPDSGGAGCYRGGLAQEVEIEILTEMKVSLVTDQVKYPPEGLLGGLNGTARVNAINGDTSIHGKKQYLLKKHDKMLIRQPGGGGFGEPLKRDSKKILHDLEEGLITPKGCERDYGFKVK